MGLIWIRQQGAEQTPLSAANPGQPLVEVVVPELSRAAQSGQRRFEQFCQQCHGAGAAGQADVAPPLVHRIYEPSHHGDGAFYAAALLGVRAHHWPFGDMPPVDGITEFEVSEIITYIRELQQANGIR